MSQATPSKLCLIGSCIIVCTFGFINFVCSHLSCAWMWSCHIASLWLQLPTMAPHVSSELCEQMVIWRYGFIEDSKTKSWIHWVKKWHHLPPMISQVPEPKPFWSAAKGHKHQWQPCMIENLNIEGYIGSEWPIKIITREVMSRPLCLHHRINMFEGP